MLVSVQNLKKLFGAEIVLDDVSFRLERREKVALVGRNGSGKTTLLKILTGELDYDGGSVTVERGATVGYLSQHSLALPDKTVLEVATEAKEHLIELQTRLRALEERFERDAGTAEEMEEYALLQSHFVEQGGYSVENDLKVVLRRLGFEEWEYSKRVGLLSGGEKTRLALAKLLLEEPELLILDEPTNHLDIEAIEWLESWVKGYGGAVLVVSHDRKFLNQVAERVIEIRSGTARTFPGPFDRYVELAKAEDQRLAEIAAKQQEEIAKMDEYVRRFMNSQRTAQARGRLKQMQKLQQQAIVIEKDGGALAAGFQKVERSGDIVLETKSLSKTFGTQNLFSNLNWTVRWKQKWGVIGPNGAGKSTLIKVAMGKIEADSGSSKLGSKVDVGWFSQDADFLDLDDTPLEAVCGATGLEFGPARSLLARFLIAGDDAFRKIKTMSGGERVKVALACLTGMNPNILILDEPTNHLDLSSCDALANVLKEFPGTVILISHDRWLLEQVADHILEIKEAHATQYEGTYQEFRRKQAQPATVTASQGKKATSSPKTPSLPVLSQRELSKEIARLTKALETAEQNVTTREQELQDLERQMANPVPGADVLAMSLRHGEIQKAIDEAFSEWTEHAQQLEEYRAMQGQAPEIGVSFREPTT